MFLIWFTLALVALTGFYIFVKRRYGEKPEYVVLAPEGELETANKSSLKFEPMSNRLIQTENGEVLDPNRYSVYSVVGDSMKPRQIAHGDKIIVEKVSKEKATIIKDNLREGDIVLLNNEKFGTYKIREIVKCDGELLHVEYYINGEKKNSSKPFNISQLKGVVRYVIPNKTPHEG